MKTFDEIIPEIMIVLHAQINDLTQLNKLVINRDLNGRIRLLVDANIPDNLKIITEKIAQSIADVLDKRIPDIDRVIYEQDLDTIIKDVPQFYLEGFPNVLFVDRLLGETNWANIQPERSDSYRIVFYSIKGGVGRSTALAATAWALAEEGKRVLILDMDLESPGISSTLLPSEKVPMYGIVDWLVEDLIDNGNAVFSHIFSSSDLSRNGEILVIPAYGKNSSEYISKIGRVWMPKIDNNKRELWHNRLERLIQELEVQHKPDVVLIDSRAGIDEISSACITNMGAKIVLLFSIDSEQTWDGYKILFEHWHKTRVVEKIRDRLQIIGALIPETSQKEYISDLCEHSWDLFTDQLYDKVAPDNANDDFFSFDRDETDAPHYPRLVFWNRGFQSLMNFHQSTGQQVIREQSKNFYGDLIEFIKGIIKNG
jgi:cellulose biosynthesis protein BcsQ